MSNFFQLLKSLSISFPCLTACPGTGSADGISSLYQACNQGFRLYVTMMGCNGIDNNRIFLILLTDLNTKLNMGSFSLTVNGFTNVMKKSGTFSKTGIDTNFGCQKTTELCNFNRVFQSVLTITGTELHTTEQFDKFRIQTMNAHF